MSTNSPPQKSECYKVKSPSTSIQPHTVNLITIYCCLHIRSINFYIALNSHILPSHGLRNRIPPPTHSPSVLILLTGGRPSSSVERRQRHAKDGICFPYWHRNLINFKRLTLGEEGKGFLWAATGASGEMAYNWYRQQGWGCSWRRRWWWTVEYGFSNWNFVYFDQ